MNDGKKGGLIPASTVLLVRDGESGLEVFMVVRHHQIDFASGALVFPGGKVDPGDSEAVVRKRARGADGLSDTELAFQAAAVREAFEECGVLLAHPAGSDALVNAARLTELERYRKPLEKDEITLGTFLEEEDLEIECRRLRPFAHWITPDMMPKRFDTLFYLAAAPEDHVAVHDGAESVDSVWIHPLKALEEADDGKRTVIFPTRMNLEKLGRASCVAEAFKAAEEDTVVTVEPRVEDRGDDGQFLCIPAEAGYSVTETPLSNLP